MRSRFSTLLAVGAILGILLHYPALATFLVAVIVGVFGLAVTGLVAAAGQPVLLAAVLAVIVWRRLNQWARRNA